MTIDIPVRLRLYRLLLRVLPVWFRREAGPELVEVFEDAHAAAGSKGGLARITFWLLQVSDLLMTALAVRLGVRGAGSSPRDRVGGGGIWTAGEWTFSAR